VSDEEVCAVVVGASASAHAKPGKAEQQLPINAKTMTPVPYPAFFFLRIKLITFSPPRTAPKKKPRTSCPSSDGL